MLGADGLPMLGWSTVGVVTTGAEGTEGNDGADGDVIEGMLG